MNYITKSSKMSSRNTSTEILYICPHAIKVKKNMHTNPTFMIGILPTVWLRYQQSPTCIPGGSLGHLPHLSPLLKGQTISSQEVPSDRMSDYTVVLSELMEIFKALCERRQI